MCKWSGRHFYLQNKHVERLTLKNRFFKQNFSWFMYFKDCQSPKMRNVLIQCTCSLMHSQLQVSKSYTNTHHVLVKSVMCQSRQLYTAKSQNWLHMAGTQCLSFILYLPKYNLLNYKNNGYIIVLIYFSFIVYLTYCNMSVVSYWWIKWYSSILG